MSRVAEVEINDAVKIVNRFFSTWAKQDLKTVINIFKDSVYSASQGPELGKTYCGRQEIEPAVRVMFDAAGDTTLNLVAIYLSTGALQHGCK